LIRVRRSLEPLALVEVRTKKLVGCAEKAQPDSGDLKGYDANGVKRLLFRDQHKKCAWCERRQDFSSSPIEHYRPKKGAFRNLPGEDRQISNVHYWWLTWTWENLLFACTRCNDAAHKGNYFPLEPGSVEAKPPDGQIPDADINSVREERPLLLNPAEDSFLRHVEWIPGNTHQARRNWTWTPRGLTARGEATIAILKLGELADELAHHLRSVLNLVEEAEQHLCASRTVEAKDTWRKVISYLGPEYDFTAATWCALNRWAIPGFDLPARPE
jgi:uncharacterized protein (TIGR02646 family)